VSDRPGLRITEIFHSLQGEGLSTGERTGFIRLTGCPLRCGYCDTAYAFTGGRWMFLDEILAEVAGFNVRYVCVTGGEPLAQRGSLELLSRLCDAGYQVSLETAGAIDVAGVDPRVTKVMDLKTPASGESDRNLYANLDHLALGDQLKFVICDPEDYRWAVRQVLSLGLPERCTVLFSAAAGRVAPGDLADWILRDQLPVRLQVQLHKTLWGDQPGR
jgi:7-carboxy-7-deazaguanine synthase